MRGMKGMHGKAPMRGPGAPNVRAIGTGGRAGSVARLEDPIVVRFIASQAGYPIPKGTRSIQIEAVQAGYDGITRQYVTGSQESSGGSGGNGGGYTKQVMKPRTGAKTLDVEVGGSNGAHSSVTIDGTKVSTNNPTLAGGIGNGGGFGAEVQGPSSATDAGPGLPTSPSTQSGSGGTGGYRQHTAPPGGGGGGGAGPFGGGGGGGGAWNSNVGIGGVPALGSTDAAYGQNGGWQSGGSNGPYSGGNGGAPGGGGGGNVGGRDNSYYGPVGTGARGEVRVTFT